MFRIEPDKRPNAVSSQYTTANTTTMFKICLIFESIGMNEFTAQRIIPITISATISESKVMISPMKKRSQIL
jgi:hypothetical protein